MNIENDLDIATSPLDNASKALLRKLKEHGLDKAGVPYIASPSVISADEFSQFLQDAYRTGGIAIAIFSDYAVENIGPHAGKASFCLNFNLV